MKGYVVPCDVRGNTVRVYGIHVEVDPRGDVANNKVLVLSIDKVINPSLAYPGAKNTFSVAHKRWSYPGGPVLKVHESTGIVFQNSIE